MSRPAIASTTHDPPSTQQFIELFHRTEEPIFFNVAGKTWKSKPQTYSAAKEKLLWRNEQGDDIYFIVNSGGTTDATITRINAVFIDWDCGKDQDGKYLPLEMVTEKKQPFLAQLMAFSLEPSVIVETRNGYQAYWLVPDATIAEFRECIKRLIAYFGSDPGVMRPANVMRLPGYYWRKPKSGCDPFFVTIVHCTGKVYLVKELLDILPAIENRQEEVDGEGKGGLVPPIKAYKVNTRAIIGGTDPPPPDSQATPAIVQPDMANPGIPGVFIADTMGKAIEYLKRLPLADYMEITQPVQDKMTIHCPFHDDVNQSASMYRLPDGKWYFNCHASTCGVKGSIIDIAMRKHDWSTSEAISRLMKQYGVRVRDEWARNQIGILDENIRLLQGIHYLNTTYPSLCYLLDRITYDLIAKIEFAKTCVVSEAYSAEQSVVFFCSLRHFERLRAGEDPERKGHNKQNRRVERYCMLGLMRRLSDEQIPRAMLEKAEKLQGGREHRIAFYSIPSYTSHLLEVADQRAAVFRESGTSVKGISWQLVHQLYGEGVAKEVYPQRETFDLSESDERFLREVEAIILREMGQKRYTSLDAVRKEMVQRHDWGQVTAARVSRTLPSLMQKYGLVAKYCNKEMKARLGILSEGFPRIIVKAGTK